MPIKHLGQCIIIIYFVCTLKCNLLNDFNRKTKVQHRNVFNWSVVVVKIFADWHVFPFPTPHLISIVWQIFDLSPLATYDMNLPFDNYYMRMWRGVMYIHTWDTGRPGQVSSAHLFVAHWLCLLLYIERQLESQSLSSWILRHQCSCKDGDDVDDRIQRWRRADAVCVAAGHWSGLGWCMKCNWFFCPRA